MDQSLTGDELDVLLGIAAGAKDVQWPAAPLGQLVVQGLVKPDEEGDGILTAKGRDALVAAAEDLAGCPEGSPEGERRARIADVLDALEGIGRA